MNAAEARDARERMAYYCGSAEAGRCFYNPPVSDVRALVADDREARELLRYIYEIGGQQFDELRWEWMCCPGCIHGGCEHAAHARYRRLLALLAELEPTEETQ